ncbi:MAG: glycosyltransferase family 2 protein [Flavisolibacter sp.]|jgi:GT2 family glycosyltransferase|nr:glycosyltransferase family 2 protein [Flavisolibacter sp.]
MRIAALLATRNRKEKTIACLQSLEQQVLSDDVQIDIYITDDASTDGTTDAVLRQFPSANIYHGDGSLFWAGGMRNSWSKAVKDSPDYYLLLNDDTLLAENAVSVLLNHPAPIAAVCIGSTVDPESGERSYGGRKLTAKHSWKDDLIVYSETNYLPCDVANANIMLVPAEVVKKIGILSSSYTHGLADYDYALMANKAGFTVYVAPGYLGSCINDHGKSWKAGSTSLKERIAYLKSPKGLAYKEYMTFIKRHFPLSYPSAMVKVWAKTFFPFIWETFRK